MNDAVLISGAWTADTLNGRRSEVAQNMTKPLTHFEPTAHVFGQVDVRRGRNQRIRQIISEFLNLIRRQHVSD